VITDFTQGADVIDLSGIDANTNSAGNNTFGSIALGTTFTGLGQLRYSFETDAAGVQHTIVRGNTTGTNAADFQIDLVGHFNLTNKDFLL
jgi:Ca2+-binding RTX toxin-like protein